MKQTEHKLWPLYPTIGHFRAHRGGLHTLTLATLKVTRFIFFFFFHTASVRAGSTLAYYVN